ncbi:MAG: hypothetical protein CMN71_10745 [Sphingomonadaceae bacterium]|nr:hypothetical protein [Sphingomonadaceae bacterium]|tara:strand:- start:18 stop:275 length:258 start_codon:yes stop_codon:yes gene_type:complete
MNWRDLLIGFVAGAGVCAVGAFFIAPRVSAQNAERAYYVVRNSGNHVLACRLAQEATIAWSKTGDREKFEEMQGDAAVACLRASM